MSTERKEAPVGVEPTMADLQSAALATWLRRLSENARKVRLFGRLEKVARAVKRNRPREAKGWWTGCRKTKRRKRQDYRKDRINEERTDCPVGAGLRGLPRGEVVFASGSMGMGASLAVDFASLGSLRLFGSNGSIIG